MTRAQVVEAVRKARVLVVGDVMLDRYWFGDVERISPEAPVPVVRVMRTRDTRAISLLMYLLFATGVVFCFAV